MQDTTNNNVAAKKVYLQTWGCQMNEYDTELIRAILVKAGYAFTADEQSADILLLNTCAIREHAHRKVYGRVHAIHHERRGRPVKIGILGCMATNLRTELFENRKLNIDFIAGPDSYKRLPELIAASFENGNKAYDLTLSEFETYSDVFPRQGKSLHPSPSSLDKPFDRLAALSTIEGPTTPLRVNAWIAVMRGCNNFCTFCVVPYTRGRERSRSLANVVEEVRRLAAEGFQQVTLLGQNVNSFRDDEGRDFADLLEAVSTVEGIERIRFTSPHPKDFPDKLLDVIATNPKVCKHIHLPLQAGNDRILQLMNRTYTQNEFRDLSKKIRNRIPGVALTTDIIVGFCSETDAEFKDTVTVMTDVAFDSAFIFKYSQRKGTIAERKWADDVPEAVKTERIVRLNELQKKISLKKNLAHRGNVYPVLIEQEGTAKSPDKVQGRTDGNHLVILPVSPSPVLPNDGGQANGNGHHTGVWVNTRITGATPHVLLGEAV